MLNWTARQALASFIFTDSSPKGTLGAVEILWLKFVPLSLRGGCMMGGRKVARMHMLLPTTWLIDPSNCL